MKSFFTKKRRPLNEKTILFVRYGDCSFSISEIDNGSYTASLHIHQEMSWHDFLSGSETLTCSKRVAEEAFDLLNRHCIIELLDEIKQSEFRDIECYPPHPFCVECDYVGLQYRFMDSYGCCYEKSCDLKTELCMTRFMLNLAELFFLIKHGQL